MSMGKKTKVLEPPWCPQCRWVRKSYHHEICIQRRGILHSCHSKVRIECNDCSQSNTSVHSIARCKPVRAHHRPRKIDCNAQIWWQFVWCSSVSYSAQIYVAWESLKLVTTRLCRDRNRRLTPGCKMALWPYQVWTATTHLIKGKRRIIKTVLQWHDFRK